MYLSGFTHRARLHELATRWLIDSVAAEDGAFLTQTFVFESVIGGPVSQRFLAAMLQVRERGPFHLCRIHRKDELRETILTGCPDPTPRMEALFGSYLERPEEFFPRTPVDLLLATDRKGTLLGMTRIKRIRRIAEKACRRITDQLTGAVEAERAALIAQRARAVGIPPNLLTTPPETHAREFSAAESIVTQAFRNKAIRFEPEDLAIHDVIGFKFVGDESELERIERAIESYPGVTLRSREVHQGTYNDIRLFIDLELPPATALIDRMASSDWSFAAGRGLTPAELARAFPAYVESGARTICAEVVLTTFAELVEAEFGRSIHEKRVLEQRRSVSYAGRLAKNAAFIIEYLLMLAISPVARVPALPIKMWGRYLPETFSRAIWQLYGVEQTETFYGADSVTHMDAAT